VHASTGAAGKGGRVKRKKAPAAVAAVVDADQQQQGDSADAAEGREMDVITVGAADETPETWARLLAGLAEICTGIGMALQSELCKYLNSQFRPTGWHRGLHYDHSTWLWASRRGRAALSPLRAHCLARHEC
jgi:hypothetical protein